MVRAGSLLLPLLAVAQLLGCWRGAIANIDAVLPRAELTAFDQEFFRTPAQMGVEHIQILGEAGGQTLLLHVWCRLARLNGKNRFYGKAFFEEAEGSAFLPHHEKFLEHLPELELRGEGGARASHAVRAVKHHQFPIHLDAEFEDDSKVFRFVPRGWKRFRQVVPEQVYSFYSKDSFPDLPGVVGVFSAVYTDDQQATFFLKALVHNIRYHLSIGYEGMVVYVRPSTMEHLWASTSLRALVREGTVILVMWTAVANLADAHGAYFDQWLICNHAAVAFWQRHVYLNFLDPDEYFATVKPMQSVQQALRGCMGAGADMYRFLIYNVGCEDCKYSNQRNHPHAERDMWLAPETDDPLKHYRKMNIPAGRGSKIFMNPNGAVTLYNHWADMAEGTVTREVEGDCAYMAHMVHLFYYRPTTVGKDDFNEKTTWWWVWDEERRLVFR